MLQKYRKLVSVPFRELFTVIAAADTKWENAPFEQKMQAIDNLSETALIMKARSAGCIQYKT